MRTIILGSAAGGGFPQWNCGCPNCVAAREGSGDVEPRTQDSLAVAATAPDVTRRLGERFLLVNASPDVLAQIKATPALWPRAPRHTPIAAVVLTNGDLDHVLGLFSLRESQPLALYATRAVLRGLDESVFMRTLQRFEGQLVVRPLELGEPVAIADALGEPIGLRVRAFATPGKVPVHLTGRAEASPEDSVGLSICEDDEAGCPSLAYLTACASLDGVALEGHAAVLFDGTFFDEDELVKLGLSRSRAKDMAHMPIGGPSGSLARLSGLGARRVYTHINNTNPILARSSEERRAVEAAGWEIAFDGMEIEL